MEHRDGPGLAGRKAGTLPQRAEARKGDLGGAAGPPHELLWNRPRARRPYWVATMHRIRLFCALGLSPRVGPG
jgi:hypothetical protein